MQVSNDILSVLSSAKCNEKMLYLPEQLDRSMYVKTNKVLEAAGGKWNRKAKAHIFDGNAEERIDEIIVTGSITVPKDDYNYFPTSIKYVNRMVANAELRDGDMFLEPSCGDGRIPIAAAAAAQLTITAIELDPKRIDYLKQDSAFVKSRASLVEGDFLAFQTTKMFDVIIMNPPFRNKADVKHVNHALDMLVKNGRMQAIMSAGVKFRTDKLTEAFRERVFSLGGVFDEMEEGAFKEAGTMVKTVLLQI